MKFPSQAVMQQLRSSVEKWEELLVHKPHGREILTDVIKHYGQYGRHYHTLQHISSMTALLIGVSEKLNSLENTLYACLWHDVVYDSTRHDNEELSASCWITDARKLELPESQIDTVSRMIQATKKHTPLDSDPDTLYFLDADLSILGASPEEYKAYMIGIWEEYRHVPQKDYREGRSAILKKFLDRPEIYFTEIFRARFDATARKNLLFEIEALSTGFTF